MNKEKIEELAKFLWHNTNMYDEGLIYDVAVSIHNAGYRKQSGWVSVKERLPEKPMDVLVYREKAFVQMLVTSYTEDDGFLLTRVSHWMPLPEPPKGE